MNSELGRSLNKYDVIMSYILLLWSADLDGPAEGEELDQSVLGNE